jgi:ABC-2 type transport system ATP-binding protein
MILVQHLSKRFGRATVLADLDFAASAGERVALVGQNGSGKTTFMRCLLGLYHYAGRIQVAGREPRAERSALLEEVAFVPQLPPAFRLTVGEYVELIEATCRVQEARIISLAHELGLDVEALWRRPFPALSGGMKQKLLSAVAIARRPRLLVMDEPGANLDPTARRILYTQLARLPDETTMLLSSHRVDELAGLVTRVVELDGGRVVLDDVVARGAALDARVGAARAFVELVGAPPSVSTTLQEWGFTAVDGGWRGAVADPDRFRFLALMTRWSGLVRRFTLDDPRASEAHGDDRSER